MFFEFISLYTVMTYKVINSYDNIYYSEDNWLIFYFVDDKLRYIKLLNYGDIRQSDFVSRYGNPVRQEWGKGGDNPARSLV